MRLRERAKQIRADANHALIGDIQQSQLFQSGELFTAAQMATELGMAGQPGARAAIRAALESMTRVNMARQHNGDGRATVYFQCPQPRHFIHTMRLAGKVDDE